MSNDRIFSPEDFNKEYNGKEKQVIKKSSSSLNIITILVIFVVIIIAVILTQVSQQETVMERQAITEKIISNDSSVKVSIKTNNRQGKKSDTMIVEKKPCQATEAKKESFPPTKAQVSSVLQGKTSIVTNNVEIEAMKVIRGDYGNGAKRKQLLGKQYQIIQERVNQLKREGVF